MTTVINVDTIDALLHNSRTVTYDKFVSVFKYLNDYVSVNKHTDDIYDKIVNIGYIFDKLIHTNNNILAKRISFETIIGILNWIPENIIYENTNCDENTTYDDTSIDYYKRRLFGRIYIDMMLVFYKFNIPFINNIDKIYNLCIMISEWLSHTKSYVMYYYMYNLEHLRMETCTFLTPIYEKLYKSKYKDQIAKSMLHIYTFFDSCLVSIQKYATDSLKNPFLVDKQEQFKTDLEKLEMFRKDSRESLFYRLMIIVPYLYGKIDELTHVSYINKALDLLCKFTDKDIEKLLVLNENYYLDNVDKSLRLPLFELSCEHARIHCIRDNCTNCLYFLDKSTNSDIFGERYTYLKTLLERKLEKYEKEHELHLNKCDIVFKTIESQTRYVHKSKNTQIHKLSHDNLVQRIKEDLAKKIALRDFQLAQQKIYERKISVISSADNITLLQLQALSTGTKITGSYKKHKKITEITEITEISETKISNVIITHEEKKVTPYFLKQEDYDTYQYIFNDNNDKHLYRNNYTYKNIISMLCSFGANVAYNCNYKHGIIEVNDHMHGSHIVVRLSNGCMSQTFVFVEWHESLYHYEIKNTKDKLTKLGFTPDVVYCAT